MKNISLLGLTILTALLCASQLGAQCNMIFNVSVYNDISPNVSHGERIRGERANG